MRRTPITATALVRSFSKSNGNRREKAAGCLDMG
jgi:hypothetical protein